MKNRYQRALKRTAHRLVPPAILKYQIAWRNYRRGEPEIRWLSQLVDARRTAVDVGAYLGAYTYFLARYARHVYAFEPQAACCNYLRRAYSKHVTVYPYALSDREGPAQLHAGADPIPNQGASLINGDKQAARSERDGSATDILVKRLDSFALDDVGFIKIDAEGEESRVLAGACETIRRSAPVLLIEIEQRHRTEPIDGIFDDIRGLGYRGQFLFEGRLHDLADFSVDDFQLARLAGDRSRPYINNFIFRPL